ncbi:hypothetical protein BJ508DRAFT_366788 [Ascobolus immersus RN42]|uniref:Uncharacterized protein n=1 Tax=Ascobolus immersus RN42 TaxID=1160509 RepID=A0A3N4HJ01_ASCIM|nr:hypothetical protein BJ508DRAFT_366788 [Ascobolus immersus RN42]
MTSYYRGDPSKPATKQLKTVDGKLLPATGMMLPQGRPISPEKSSDVADKTKRTGLVELEEEETSPQNSSIAIGRSASKKRNRDATGDSNAAQTAPVKKRSTGKASVSDDGKSQAKEVVIVDPEPEEYAQAVAQSSDQQKSASFQNYQRKLVVERIRRQRKGLEKYLEMMKELCVALNLPVAVFETGKVIFGLL